jgi:predicted branched-subunit amino acid permease
MPNRRRAFFTLSVLSWLTWGGMCVVALAGGPDFPKPRTLALLAAVVCSVLARDEPR